MSISELQQQFPAFEKGLVQEIEANSEIRSFTAGEQLMRTGQYFKSTLLIIDGLVKVYREDDQGNEFFMYYLQPGQACALSMVCAVKQETSQIMAKAVKDTEVISIPLSYMDEWMSKYKSWYHFVLETYRSRFEELLVTIDHIAFRAMDERLEFYLKKHVQTLGSNTIPLSHQEIADELNSSREVISRLLKKMEQLGKVKLQRNSIEVIRLG
ncbi:Crp/Fnr family transcriptional regulator [Flavihumibacter sp. CACIAM 22H1]|uniref:Crp/Fnr family transcriptional regulator n=1 Tax=Flavihumibacter sp. CACIAM 22H1 TaxID=1812911 RepID=UPI0007A82441|nr:Crp/Fnr family transcriptional regulator [Flavihumibacter sp. CACIAM 22H1]KYP16395.1 MAG: Crp/Fnr family transcriptional regulator [Flavihumibacter sp. CACIAM 22H1]